MKLTTMKQQIILCATAILLGLSSCDLFEIDNYDAPAETIRGEIVDVATGNRVLTDQGSEGIRVRLTELSWGPNVQHNPDFYCRPDGTFQNTKLFKGEYNIRVDGPFIPLVRESSDGTLIYDGSQTTTISGITEVKFQVEPFLTVTFVDTPRVSDGKITAQVKVERGVSPQTFRAKIEPMGGWSEDFLNVTDVQLFVSYSSSVGYRARDERWSNSINYERNSFESLLGQPISISSKGTIPSGRKVFVRAAARINYDTPKGSGTRRWNYSAPVEVTIP